MSTGYTFRDHGLTSPRAPAGCVRASFSAGRIVGQYIFSGIVVALGIGLAVLFLWILPTPMRWLGCAAALAGFGAIFFLATHHDYQWIELDGDRLRAKQLYTRRIVERSIDEIDCLGTIVFPRVNLSTAIVSNLLGWVRGIEIRFRDRRTPLRVMRADPKMQNAEELIAAVTYRMEQRGELDLQTIEVQKRTVVRSIYWKNREPAPPPTKGLKGVLGCLMFMALMFGSISAFEGAALQREQTIGSTPTQEISLRALIEHGPGDNPHVTLTDFRAGGYAMETQNEKWTEVWVALFPNDALAMTPSGLSPPGFRPPLVRPPFSSPPMNGAGSGGAEQIHVVFCTQHARSESDLVQWMRSGRLTGVCSKEPRTHWGATMGPELVKANKGAALTSAWSIQEMFNPPGEADVRAATLRATACLAATLGLAMAMFWVGMRN